MRRSLIVGLAAMCWTVAAQAEEVVIGGFHIEGLHQADGQGLYDQVLAAVGKANGITYNIKVQPPNRLFQSFEAGDIGCVSPADLNPDFYDFSFETLVSSSMTDAKVYIFLPQGSTPTSDLATLKGKVVGVRAGMPYGKRVEAAGLNFEEAPTIESNIKKLEHKRIDAFLAYSPEVYATFDGLKMEPLPHTPDAPVSIHRDSVLCRTDMGGAEIIETFNAGFAAIKADGTLAKIMGE